MKLTARVRYATRFLMELSRNPDQSAINISAISTRQGISMKYLEQLIRPLKQAKIIDSVRGPKGGHILVKSTEDITLGEITRIFEGPPESIDTVELSGPKTERQDYVIRRAWLEATQALYAKLDGISLNNLIACTRDKGS